LLIDIWTHLGISWYKVRECDWSICLLQEIQALGLQNQALLALSALAGQQGGTGSGLEDFADTLVGLGRALEVFVGTNLLANFLALHASS